ncbi:MAG: hypothetical protein WCI11_21120 [Candidatus Methylumidiphilus sp.]
MELHEIVSLWWDHELNSKNVLWGVEIIWWGRIGRLLQLIAAFAIIAELIGSVKLSQYGLRLHTGSFAIKQIKRYLKDSFAYSKLMLSAFNTDNKQEVDEYLNKAEAYHYPKAINMKLSVIATMGHVFYFSLKEMISEQEVTFLVFALAEFIAGSVFFGFCYFFIVPIFVSLTMLVLYVSGFALDVFIFKPVSTYLRLPVVCELTKILGLLFFVIGFILDSLAYA